MDETIPDEIGEAIKKYFAALSAGLCPFCGAKVEQEKQIGRCVYGVPCGHRLFQGKARQRNSER